MTTLEIIAAATLPGLLTFYISARIALTNGRNNFDAFVGAVVLAVTWPIGLLWILAFTRTTREPERLRAARELAEESRLLDEALGREP